MRFVLFLHVLGALAIGFYLLLPFVTSRLGKLEPAGQAGFAKGLLQLNRWGQWLLIVQFVTGGYLISKYDMLTVLWMIVVIVLFVVLGAVTGMLSGPLKRIVGAGDEGKAPEDKDLSKAGTFSAIAAVMVLVLLVLMYYPELLGTRM